MGAVAPDLVTLASGRATAEFAPSVGARLMRWSVNGRPVLHWPGEADWSAPAKIRGGNPLLFPLIARTFLDGKIGFWRGPDGVVRPAPMHGLVREAPFETMARDERHVVMRTVWENSMAEAWPFPFAFTVEYALEGDSLAVAFTVENTGAEAMPFSVGNHFYFEIPAEERDHWMLEGKFASFARQDAEGRITPAPAPAGGGLLSDPEMVDLFHVGPSRDGVVLRHANDGRGVVFECSPDAEGENPWYAVTTWTESATSNFYCVEPWTALPDAVHNGLGLRWLRPGTRETLRLRLTARGW
jgi:galactose mutarotase-like enzyme